jgi:uncharacterized protein (DUF486 family)
MSPIHTLFGFLTVSAQAAPYVVVLLYGLAGCFLTMAWFFHLKFPPHWPWWSFVGISWGVFALCEYLFANQATRLGNLGGYYSISELKTIQVTTAIVAYLVFAYFILGEKLTPYHLGGFSLIIIGAASIFMAPK